MTDHLTPSQEWWTAEELASAGLPDLPASRQGVEAAIKRLQWRADPNHARRRAGKGGGWEYSWRLLPDRAKRKLLQAAAAVAEAHKAPAARQGRDEAWSWYEKLPGAVKAKAETRLSLIQQVEALERVQGRGRHMAVVDVARTNGVGARTLWSWIGLIEGIRADDRLPYLAPRNRAADERPRAKEFSLDFYEMLCADYLRVEASTFSDSYRRVVKVAKKNGWDYLPERTMRRVMDRRVSTVSQTLARKGVEALKRLYPAQVRDKTALRPMEAVNADFHKFDVFVNWPVARGEEPMITRPQMVAFQDIYSGRILSWRVDVSANSAAVQLCAGDMIETWGIPEHVLLDNGREFAAKKITGGSKTRYRFKVKEEDVPGLFTALDCKIHFATPYHGQAKPIERAFRDMCQSIAKDPRFAGAYTGNRPDAKPENYGSKAIPLDEFLRVLAEGIEEHNTRQDRRSEVAYGRSFAEVFDEAYPTAGVRKATEAQRRLWLLGSEGVRAKKSGSIWFAKNEFYADWLHAHADQRLVIRFDLAAFHDGVHVYSFDNAYLGFAPCRQAAGFLDADEAKNITRLRKQWLKAEKAELAAHRKLSVAQLGAMLDDVAPEPLSPVEMKVIKPLFGRKGISAQTDTRVARRHGGEQISPDEIAAKQAAMILDASDRFGAGRQTTVETETDRFKRALDLERRAGAGEALTVEQQRWLSVYQSQPEYRAQRGIYEAFGDTMFG